MTPAIEELVFGLSLITERLISPNNGKRVNVITDLDREQSLFHSKRASTGTVVIGGGGALRDDPENG